MLSIMRTLGKSSYADTVFESFKSSYATTCPFANLATDSVKKTNLKKIATCWPATGQPASRPTTYRSRNPSGQLLVADGKPSGQLLIGPTIGKLH